MRSCDCCDSFTFRFAIPSPFTIRYVSAPTTGRKMMKNVHNAFEPPPMSWRRKTSLRIAIRNQIQITQRKKMIIVQNTSRNG